MIRKLRVSLAAFALIATNVVNADIYMLTLEQSINLAKEKSYTMRNLKENLKEMTEEEQLQLLASDGMLVKRPILILEDRVLVGFREAQWQEALQNR